MILTLSQLTNRLEHLSGFADRNGDEKHNLALSANRINTVKNLLMKEGVDEQKILTKCFNKIFLLDSGLKSIFQS